MTADDPGADLHELAGLLRIDPVGLAEMLPAPVTRVEPRGYEDLAESRGTWFSTGDPVMVLVAVGPTQVAVAEPEVNWHGPSLPVLRATKLVSMRADSEGFLPWLRTEVARVHADRLGRFRRCGKCGESNPPEWTHGNDLCQQCSGALY